jgi:hypothetical protein
VAKWSGADRGRHAGDVVGRAPDLDPHRLASFYGEERPGGAIVVPEAVTPLPTCRRTDASLEAALAEVGHILAAAGVDVAIRKTLVAPASSVTTPTRTRMRWQQSWSGSPSKAPFFCSQTVRSLTQEEEGGGVRIVLSISPRTQTGSIP